MELVPHLVEKESNAHEFIMTEGYDMDAAARRRARYWKARKYLFGERWILPMNQTGNGALSQDDVALLRTGYYNLIPIPGRGVLILMDESRLTRAPGHTNARIVFYYCYIYACQSERGIDAVHVINGDKRPPLDVHWESWANFRNALPLRVKPNIVVAQSYEPEKQELLSYLAYKTQRVAQFRNKGNIPLVAGNSFQHTLRLLQDHGLNREYLPRCLGGDYSYDRFHDWVCWRLSVEGAMSAAPVMAQLAVAMAEGKRTATQQQQQHRRLLGPVATNNRDGLDISDPITNKGVLPTSAATDGAITLISARALATTSAKPPPAAATKPTVTRKKRIDTYERRRIKLRDLEQEKACLEKQNRALKQSNRQLEGYLCQARLTVRRAFQFPDPETHAPNTCIEFKDDGNEPASVMALGATIPHIEEGVCPEGDLNAAPGWQEDGNKMLGVDGPEAYTTLKELLQVELPFDPLKHEELS